MKSSSGRHALADACTINAILGPTLNVLISRLCVTMRHPDSQAVSGTRTTAQNYRSCSAAGAGHSPCVLRFRYVGLMQMFCVPQLPTALSHRPSFLPSFLPSLSHRPCACKENVSKIMQLAGASQNNKTHRKAERSIQATPRRHHSTMK